MLIVSAHAYGDARPSKKAPSKPAATLELLNPVTFLKSIASLLSPQLAAPRADALVSFATDQRLAIDFASGGDEERVSLVLAESQIRVRLAPDLHLRCEISSNERENADAEVELGLGVQFRFK